MKRASTDAPKPPAAVQPPPTLPPEYLEVWKFLQAADGRAASRQTLARSLGLSTHTIQRILVSGEVPHFPETSNTRILRSWARIITRLAFHAGQEPRRWIKMIGIPWSDEVRSASEAALERASGRRTGSMGRTDREPRASGPGAWPQEAGLPWRLPRAIRVGIAEGPALDRQFFEEYARRVLTALAPEATLEFDALDEGEIVSRVASTGPQSLDVGFGITDTADRRARGLEFTGLPGLSIELAAIHLPMGGGEPTRFIVTAEGLGARYLRSQCGVTGERLTLVESSDPAVIARALIAETRREPQHLVAFVGDELSAALVAGEAERLESCKVEYASIGPDEHPGYPVAVALAPGLGARGRDLVEGAIQEMFVSVPVSTAKLYAEMIARNVLSRPALALLDPVGARGILRLRDFGRAAAGATAEAEAAFKTALAADLAARLSAGVEQKIREADLLPGGSSHSEVARRIARAFIRRMLPGAEAATIPLPVAPGLAATPAAQSAFCLSCSAPLADEHNKGASDRYCRFCSDESGSLRPRAEVERVLAEWFGHWRDGLPADEALRRARGYMEAMPAWCRN